MIHCTCNVVEMDTNTKRSNHKLVKLSIIAGAIFVIFAFYLLAIRPSQIKRDCYREATKARYDFTLKKVDPNNIRYSDKEYAECLKKMGL